MAEINSVLTRQSLMPEKLHENKHSRNFEDKKILIKNSMEDALEEDLIFEAEDAIGLPTEAQRDELASLVTVFRQRREWERKTSISNDSSFDQILEDGDTQDKINQFFRLISADTSSDMKRFFVFMQRFFNDESDMYFVLQTLMRRKNLSKQLKTKFKNALIFLEETVDPKKLKGGMNVALKARRFSSKLEIKPAIIRNSYRQFLEDESEALDIYYNWIIQFGYTKRDIILEFMENALLSDMMSLDPSCSKSEFGNLLTRMKQLNILHSTESILSAQVKKNMMLMQLNGSSLAWFQFFYYCIRDPERVSEEMTLLTGTQFKFLSHTERGIVLQSVYHLFMLIPTELFGDIDLKERLKSVLTELSDINFKQQNKM